MLLYLILQPLVYLILLTGIIFMTREFIQKITDRTPKEAGKNIKLALKKKKLFTRESGQNGFCLSEAFYTISYTGQQTQNLISF